MREHATRRSRFAALGEFTRRTLVLLGAAIAASISFVVIAAAMLRGELDRTDRTVELAIHRLDSGPADAVMTSATLIGSNAMLILAVAIVALLAIRLRKRAVAIVLAIDAAVVIAATNVLQSIFGRERPRLFDKIDLPTSYSFPSGHAMSAVGIYGVIAAALIVLYPRARLPIIVSATLLIIAIGVSRIYLGVHWPFDVLGGFLAGIPPMVASVHLLHRSTRERPDDPVDARRPSRR